MKEALIDRWAVQLRDAFKSHIGTARKATRTRKSSDQWRNDLNENFARQTLSNTANWEYNLEVSKQRLDNEWPGLGALIQKMKNEIKSMLRDFMKTEGFRAVIYLRDNPPKDSNWDPQLAPKVVYRALRFESFNCKEKTFMNFLRHPKRMQQLKYSIPDPGLFPLSY